jgi:hypothetical protein
MKINKNYTQFSKLWNENPQFVIGLDGEKIPKEKAILIKGAYYEKNKSAIWLEDSWFSLNDEKIMRDEYSKQYFKKSYALKVIVNERRQTGFCDKTKISYVSARTVNSEGSVVEESIIASPELAVKLGYKECYNSGLFYIGQSQYWDHKISPEMFNHTQKIQHEVGVQDFNIPYNTRYGLASQTFIKTEGKQYSFGIELETASGCIKRHVYQNKLNMSAVHDGSITGGEYVTGILSGDQGLLHLKKICNELSKRCTVDDKAGIHVHIGNFIPNKEFTIYSYILGHLLQDEIYAMLPASRRNGEYCQPLNTESSTYRQVLTCLKEASKQNKIGYEYQMSQAYELIFKWLSNGPEPSDTCNKATSHPQGRYCGGHSSARYKWLNLIPTNFSKMRFNERSEKETSFDPIVKTISQTIEFRNHSGTLSYRKIEAWILLTISFVWYIEHRKNEILQTVLGARTINLIDIVTEACPKSSISLIAYIAQRTHMFSGRADAVKADYLADIDEKEIKITEFVKQNFKCA